MRRVASARTRPTRCLDAHRTLPCSVPHNRTPRLAACAWAARRAAERWADVVHAILQGAPISRIHCTIMLHTPASIFSHLPCRSDFAPFIIFHTTADRTHRKFLFLRTKRGKPLSAPRRNASEHERVFIENERDTLPLAATSRARNWLVFLAQKSGLIALNHPAPQSWLRPSLPAASSPCAVVCSLGSYTYTHARTHTHPHARTHTSTNAMTDAAHLRAT